VYHTPRGFRAVLRVLVPIFDTMATNSHKRRAGDEHLGFQSVSVRVRSAARVDPFESLMATKVRPFRRLEADYLQRHAEDPENL